MLTHRSSVIEDIVDLDRYPIHRLDSPVRAELVADTRAQMDAVGCCRISDFIRPQAIEAMREEAERLRAQITWAVMDHNPYAGPDDPTLPAAHPRRRFQHRESGFINSDQLDGDSILNRIYDADVMTHFVWECLGTPQPIYRWADPLGCNPYGIMETDHYFPWHFDGNEFTISILVQRADYGGVFEYVPDIRTPDDERFDAVQRVLDGDRSDIRELDLAPGDLQIFKGRFSMHRVTPIEGPTTRIVALPTYVYDPFRMNSPHHAKTFYGRATSLHETRAGLLVDGLVD